MLYLPPLDHVAGHEDRLLDVEAVNAIELVLIIVLIVGFIYALYLFFTSQFRNMGAAFGALVCLLLAFLVLVLL